MTRKIASLCIVVFLFGNQSLAQIVHNDALFDWPEFYAEPMPRASMWLGAEQSENPGILYFGGFSFYEPRFYLFNLKAGFGLNTDASWFLINKTYDYAKKAREPILIVKGDSRQEIERIPVKGTFSFGPKISGNVNFRREINATTDFLGFGLTIHRAKYVDYAKFEEQDGSWSNRLHIDLMGYWFFNHMYVPNEDNFNSQQAFDIYTITDPRDLGVGFLVTWYTAANRHSNGPPAGGFRFHMGAGMAPSKAEGLFFSFGVGLLIQSQRSMSHTSHEDFETRW